MSSSVEFDDLAARYDLEKIKTFGDGYMAVSEATAIAGDHAIRAVSMGLEMIDQAQRYGHEVELPLDLRVGIHSGPVVAGVIGRMRVSYDVWGDTVNVASRMESQGVPGAVQVSERVAGLVERSHAVDPVGTIEVKGRGPMQAFLIRPMRAVTETTKHPEEPSGA